MISIFASQGDRRNENMSLHYLSLLLFVALNSRSIEEKICHVSDHGVYPGNAITSGLASEIDFVNEFVNKIKTNFISSIC